MSSSSGSNTRMTTDAQQAADRSQRKKDKRQRQADLKKATAAAASASRMVLGSSDSDGFIQVEMEDVKSLAEKASDDEIRRLERNLERLKAARREPVSTDSDQSVAGKVRRSDSTEELSEFAAQLPYPAGVVDKALSEPSPGRLGKAERRVPYTLCDRTRPDTPAAADEWGSEVVRFGKAVVVLGDANVVQAELVGNARSNDGWDWSNGQEAIDLDSLPLTPIPELLVHKEAYSDPTPYPLADIEQHPTFEGGRSLNDKGIVCCKRTQRYVFSAMAWVRNDVDPRRGVVTTLCDWRNSDVEKLLNLQKEKDQYMQKC
eukprot:5854580-Amphidinium_carterae.1